MDEKDSPPWREGPPVCTNCGETAKPHPAYADFVGPFCEGCWDRLREYFSRDTVTNMTTLKVLKTARGFARQGHGPAACSIGDWPEAADAFRRANRWTLFRWLPVQTKGMLVRAFDRAIREAERQKS
jgi:hypothetical protein